MAFWQAADDFWSNNRVLAWTLPLPGVAAVIFTFLKPQSPGISIGILALAAGIMSLRPQMRPREKFMWMTVLVALTVLEVKAIGKNDQENAEIRGRQNEQFHSIAEGLKTSLATSETQFVSTITHVDGVLQTTQQVSELARNTLANLTGGNSFANVTPQIGLRELPLHLTIYNNGTHILTGVTIGIRKGLIEADNPSPWSDLGGPQISVGTVAPHEPRVLSFTIMPHLGKSGLDVYILTISAQNFSVDEQLSFRKGQNQPFAYKENVIHNYPISTVGNTTKYRTDVLLDRDWSDGPKTEKP